MLYGGRPPVLGDGADLLQLDPFAHGAYDGELFKVGDGTAVVFRKPDADVVLLPFFLVLRGGHAVDAVAHHARNGGAAESVQGQFFLVEHHLQLGLVVFAAHGNFGGRWHGAHPVADLLGQGVGGIKVITIDFNIYLAFAAHTHAAARGGNRSGNDFRILGQLLTHIVGNLPNGALPVFHILKPHHDVNNVRPGAAEEGEHAAFVVCTGRGGSNHHFRVALPDHLLHLAGGFHGLFHPGTGLQFNGH